MRLVDAGELSLDALLPPLVDVALRNMGLNVTLEQVRVGAIT